MFRGKKQKNTTKNTNDSFTAADAVRYLDNLEMKHHLFDYQIDGWSVWTVIKFGIGIHLNGRQTPFKAKKITRLNQILFAIHDITQFLKPQRAVRYVILTSSSRLDEKNDGYYKESRFDDFLLNTSFFKTEQINNKAFLKNSRQLFIRRNISTSLVILIVSLMRRLYNNNEEINNIAKKIVETLHQEPELQKISFNSIQSSITGFIYQKKVYKWLLRYLRPEVVLVSDAGYYSMIAAAKELGVKTVEFQHGFLDSESHVAYSWGSHVVRYKQYLPIADMFFLYGDYWKEQLTKKGFWEDELQVIGSARVDKFRAIARENLDKSICTILWTTQGIDVENSIRFIDKFIKLAQGVINIRLIVKLHPIYDTNKEIYQSVFDSNDNIQIFLGNEDPSTFELITKANIHISISSTCHYEALGLGVPTVILGLSTSEKVFLDLYDEGYALLARNPQELLDIVKQWETYTVASEISSYYFKPDTLANMKRELGYKEK